jgi:hypothetical protein
MTLKNLGSKTEVLSLLGNDVLASTAVGSAVDIQGYEGSAAFVLTAEAGGSGITYAIKITECDTSGGTYTDVTDGAFTTTSANTALVEKIYLNVSELKQYLKISSTVSGGTGAGAVAVVALASKKYG